VEREKEVLKGELAKAQAKIKHAETSIADHTAHIEHLQHIIEEADAEHLRQQKELEIIKSERTVLGAQVLIVSLLFLLFVDKMPSTVVILVSNLLWIWADVFWSLQFFTACWADEFYPWDLLIGTCAVDKEE
jgi:hypothetical protein